jgi:hypothetical protein
VGPTAGPEAVARKKHSIIPPAENKTPVVQPKLFFWVPEILNMAAAIFSFKFTTFMTRFSFLYDSHTRITEQFK